MFSEWQLLLLLWKDHQTSGQLPISYFLSRIWNTFSSVCLVSRDSAKSHGGVFEKHNMPFVWTALLLLFDDDDDGSEDNGHN